MRRARAWHQEQCSLVLFRCSSAEWREVHVGPGEQTLPWRDAIISDSTGDGDGLMPSGAPLSLACGELHP
jgi:hypothetical protein